MRVAMDSGQPRLSPVRGLLAAGLGALGGTLAPIAILALFTVCRWYFESAPTIDRQSDLDQFRGKLLWPVIACATVCACAAWATVAPQGTFHFAKTLAIIFAVCLPLWVAPILMGLSPRQPFKSADEPAIYPSELMVMIGAPILVAASLTAIRICGTPHSHTGIPLHPPHPPR